MSRSTHATLDDRIAREAISFSPDSPETFDAAVDAVIASLGGAVELLGFGEALHGGEEILMLRNRLFRRLAEVHGYSAIAIESSFPRAHTVNEYVAGRGPASYETGFSHGFGRLDANRELVDWMREYNADPSHPVKLRFYGFDSPTEMGSTASPRQVLQFVLDYLASVDGGDERQERIDLLLGSDFDWENPAAFVDPAKAIGLSPAATELRAETEDLIEELCIRRPELTATSGTDRYREAVQYARLARQLLNYHAALARESGDRVATGLGIRDATMADNLAYAVFRERGRGKVFAFAHNRHLQRGRAEWRFGTDVYRWWPAGSHLAETFGPRYAVIGTGIGVSGANGIGTPEAGTLEALLTGVPGPVRLVPTHRGQGLSAQAVADLPTRSGSVKNPTYFPLTAESFTDFDWLAVTDTTGYARGGPPLP